MNAISNVVTRFRQAFVRATVIEPAADPATGWWWLHHPLPLNIVSFFFLSLFAFRAYAPLLFHGVDGRFEISLLTLSSLFVPPQFGLTNDFFHGLGNVWFAVNPAFLPGYLLSLSAPGEMTNFALAYAVCATELFVATYIAGRLIGIHRMTALIAAWVVPLLSFQYAGWNLVPTTFRAFPHYATIAGVNALIGVALLRVGAAKPLGAALLGVAVFAGISYIVIVAPLLLILGAPFLAACGLAALAPSGDRRKTAIAAAIMGAIVLLCIAAGYASFVIGLTTYSAANVFRELAVRPAEMREVSMLFWSPWSRPFAVERTFVLLGLLGGLWAALRGQGILRRAALAFTGVSALYLAVGIAHVRYHFWFGPAFWYFEGFLFPFHGLFASLLVLEPLRTIGVYAARWLDSPTRLQSRTLAAVLATVIAVVPWYYVWHRQAVAGPANSPYYTPHPHPETSITRILKDEIAIKPGDPFRGRVATMTGRIFPTTTNVDHFELGGMTEMLAQFATGNPHQGSGLWQDAIPTLLEYSPTISPAYFVFLRAFFTEPADQQFRNLVLTRRIDPRLLALLGVRFVITDAPFAGPARLRQTLDIPLIQDILSRTGMSKVAVPFTLHLYELDGANLGQYSPTQQRLASTASDMLDLLGDPSIDLTKTFVVADSIAGPLVPAHSSEFRVEKGSFRIKAESAGSSVLILPMEFSRCLRVVPGAANRVKLFRADLLLTGVLFEKSLDTRIEYFTGPLRGSRCRLEDAQDAKQMQIHNAFRHRPEFAPAPFESYEFRP